MRREALVGVCGAQGACCEGRARACCSGLRESVRVRCGRMSERVRERERVDGWAVRELRERRERACERTEHASERRSVRELREGGWGVGADELALDPAPAL
eukprot:3941403-Rhodomonas_salina.7